MFEKAVDHSSQNSLEKPKKNPKQHSEEIQQEKENNEKQQTIETIFRASTEAKLTNIKTKQSFVRFLVARKIPFNVAGNQETKNFVPTFVRGGGALPGPTGLSTYLEDTYRADKEKLRKMVSGKNLAVSFDETFDEEGRYVCCILFTVISTGYSFSPMLASVEFEPKLYSSQTSFTQFVSPCLFVPYSEFGVEKPY